jgi:hypothetical protein
MCDHRPTRDAGVPHPNAPTGGGGPGGFSACGPLGRHPPAMNSAPHAQAPAQRILGLGGVVLVQASTQSSPPGNLNDAVRSAAAGQVGQPVVGSGECYDLADKVLRDSGAHSAPHYGRITRDADYHWGKPVRLDQVKPGDILQFRNHRIHIVTVTKTRTTSPDGAWTEQANTQTEDRVRPHHTAIVLAVQDGNFVVAEQHVLDHTTNQLSTTVRENTFPIHSRRPQTTHRQLPSPSPGTRVEETITVTVTVSGTIRAYRPQAVHSGSTVPGQQPVHHSHPAGHHRHH